MSLMRLPWNGSKLLRRFRSVRRKHGRLASNFPYSRLNFKKRNYTGKLNVINDRKLCVYCTFICITFDDFPGGRRNLTTIKSFLPVFNFITILPPKTPYCPFSVGKYDANGSRKKLFYFNFRTVIGHFRESVFVILKLFRLH